MHRNLFNHVDIQPENIHIPSGEWSKEKMKAHCADYEKAIDDAGGVDLQILGIGNNGHIGFNEPSSSFGAETRYIALAESTIEANARFFASKEDVPQHALSMGIKTIMMAGKILLIVTGEHKAKILKDTVMGPIVPKVPASVLQLHRDVTIVADMDAAKLLRR